MAFGIYVHIPYCLQICTYCDFAKYELGSIPEQSQYTKLLLEEISQKEKFVPKNSVTSIYFGGGTPSLMLPEQLHMVIESLRSRFPFSADIEITLEINPGTLSEDLVDQFQKIGVNRFSVGAQTFDSELLKVTGRKHSVEDTITTLCLLRDRKVNYTLDILYALPNQSVEQLKKDLIMAASFNPSQVSCYYLTVPEKHPLNQNRASDEEQEQMMDTLESTLSSFGIYRYEISNYSKPGMESKHNLVYWKDKPYWGLGLGAHSYLEQDKTPMGVRFWNPSSYTAYEKYVFSLKNINKLYETLPKENVEILEKHQALTDYCHTFLRCLDGFFLDALEQKFSPLPKKFYISLEKLMSRNLISKEGNRYFLSQEGRKLTNLVFGELTFLRSEI